eukprot:gnl/TRDRNA2_/TRDRNA2_32465_c0_seq1.p1 gnl/TRDRNA2_/TRDRNA2_32465_c0~~gnl/TRDRNA2_/TRDRNA2_32465_c0_seq1.p1  ORF type:complete len:296 (+),score=35.97 gnl/TRDRNA2_/TRDRNA2_32465_c0_seq1:41-928(+)
MARVVVRRLGGALGAEIRGVDLARPLQAQDASRVRELLGEHQVLCFRGYRHLDSVAQIEFTRIFGTGEVKPHPLGSRADSHPADIPLEVMVVRNALAEGKEATVMNDVWHSDLSCMEKPPAVSVLKALTVPDGGGDTCFASCYAAYDELSDGMKNMLLGLRAIHNSDCFQPNFKGSDKRGAGETFKKHAPDISHPVVRVHPETGRRSLFLSQNFTDRFDGMTREESLPLLNYLFSRMTRPENVYRHQWQEGDVVVWDNRSTLHYGVFDYGTKPRELHRTTAEGDRPAPFPSNTYI